MGIRGAIGMFFMKLVTVSLLGTNHRNASDRKISTTGGGGGGVVVLFVCMISGVVDVLPQSLVACFCK